ncbi:39S ribosomal protein L1, mitochondrial [Bufo bufo]|uniref:39S ribosomal protein L1, mitochondrial n=1 Tax=Bufo bufo TaxID=8384 RepID=UPI001ABEA845|nr:39S ribosomal protein L1, mitochondrial [Bufo bufo]
MAAPVCCLRTVIHGCHRHVFKQAGFITPSLTITNRSWFAVRSYAAQSAAIKKFSKEKKTSKEPFTKKLSKGQLAEKETESARPKRFGFTAQKPTDDVYVARYYPKPLLEPETAIEMLKTFQRLDFCNPVQPVFVGLKLDMKLEKKKKVDPFVGYIHLPFPFVKEPNKVLVFTEKAEEAEIAKNNGASFVGGIELIPQILNDEIQADFYIATPDIIAQLNILKNKLRKKFPKTKRGSVGNDVANMMKLFETSYEYTVERECLVQTKIATLDMPVEHIVANLDALVKDVCKHKPLSFGPFVEKALLTSATSESLFINCQKFFPHEVENIDEE